MDAHVVPGPSVVNVSPPVSLSPPVSPWPPVRKAWPDARTAERASMVLIVSGAAVLYGWDLDRQGWANAYYAAAAQAGAHSWKALLFGGLDAGGAMATDKPPLALWLMSGSVRIFGVNTWGIMLPQVLAALATIVLLQRTVRRCCGSAAGVIAAAVLAVTPVFGVLARFDDPDVLLVLLLVAAAYATIRATESAGWRWPALLGALLGAAFLTKWLVAVLVVPGIAAAYAIAAGGTSNPRSAGPACRRAVAATATTALLVGGWWVALVALTPVRDRPHLDGSANDSVWSLILGRNGFGRLAGPGSIHHAAAAVGGVPVSGIPGLLRLLTPPFALQIGWFVPPAALALLLWLLRRAHGDPARPRLRSAAYVLWGVWLGVADGVFSFMTGPMHPYYTVLLAPAAAALVGMGAVDLARSWSASGERRSGDDPAAKAERRQAWMAAGVVSVSMGWVGLLCVRAHGLPRWLAAVVIGGGIGAALAIGGVPGLPRAPGPYRRAVVAVMALLALLAAPLATSIATDGRSVTGANPLAGPGPSAPQPVTQPLASFLRSHRGTATWGAAVVTATPAARLQLDSGVPILPVGGFMGSVPTPTLTQVRDWVSEGRLRYLVLGGPYLAFAPGETPGSLDGTQAARIVTWAQTHGLRITVPGDPTTIYDLAPERSAGTRG